MADNYFSILGNRVPEIWFDQGVELGGGQPFTSGTAGDERNKRHILRAAMYLEQVVECAGSSCLEWPYVTLNSARHNRIATSQHVFNLPPSRKPVYAACAVRSCILETNIRLLPQAVVHHGDKIGDMLEIEKYNVKLMGEDEASHYVAFPPSHMVDSRTNTFFQSPRGTLLQPLTSTLVADLQCRCSSRRIHSSRPPG